MRYNIINKGGQVCYANLRPRNFSGGNIMKKIVSIILVCMMFATLLPMGIFADAGVTEIDTAEDFANIANNLGGSYKLTADITITEPLSYKNEGALFTGTFDGNGKTITINFADADAARTGLFCSAGGCTIKNLTVTGTLTSTGNSCSGLIGTLKGADQVTIDNVTVDIDLPYANADNGHGGFIGCVEDDNAKVTITNSTNKGDVTGNKPGGFIGNVNNKGAVIVLEDCVNEGTVECTNQYSDYRGAGGFIGVVNNGENTNITIKNCTNKGTIIANYTAANAFVGHNNAAVYDTTGSTNTGKVISGGVELDAATAVARPLGTWGWGGFNYNKVTYVLSGNPNFHALPNLTGFTAYVNGKLSNKVTATEVAGGNREVRIEAPIDPSLVDGKTMVTLIWADGSYSSFGIPEFKAADINSDYFTIDSEEEYIEFVNTVNEKNGEYMIGFGIKVTTDLDFTGMTVPAFNKMFLDLDFQGHKVYNLVRVVDNAEGNVGLIANEISNRNFNGVIKNVVLKNCSLTVNAAEGKEVTVGGVAGHCDRANVESATLENVSVKVNGAGVVGGVIGAKGWGGPGDMTVTIKDTVIDAPNATVGLLVGKQWNWGGNEDSAKVNVLAADVTATVTSTNEVTATTFVGDIGVAATVTVAETGVTATLVEDAEGYDPEWTVPEPVVPKTGDAITVMIAVSAIALAAIAFVVSKKRSYQN